jgi:hypothetical protein
MNRVTESVVTIIVAIIGLATLAVILSQRATTVGVINAGSKGLMGLIGTAVSPITGGASSFSNPNGGF